MPQWQSELWESSDTSNAHTAGRSSLYIKESETKKQIANAARAIGTL
jgi:hypothetical protein